MDIVKETEQTDKLTTQQSALVDIRDLDLSVSSKINFCCSVCVFSEGVHVWLLLVLIQMCFQRKHW